MILAILAACTGGDTDPPTDPLPPGSANYSGSLGPGPDFSAAHGRLSAVVYPSEVGGGGSIAGAFADGPPVRFHAESAREGNCRIVSYTASTCDPACGGNQACVGGSCVDYPTRAPRGTLTWRFPGGERALEPDGTNAYDGFAPEATEGPMELEIEGEVLQTPPAPSLSPDGDWSAALSGRGAGDATLAWSNPMEGARVRLAMTDCTGSHGGLAANELECEGPDTGELVIPAAFMQIMEDADWSRGECGSHVFHRYHAASMADDDLTRFEARSGDQLFWRPDF